MTTRGQVNSNFYQIVNVDSNGNPTSVKSSFITEAAQANNANYAGNVTVGNQPNITGLGTLTGLTSTGNITAPYFIGDVVGNITGNLIVPGVTYDIIYNNNGNANASDNLTFNFNSNVLTVIGNVTSTNANLGNLAVANYFSGSGNLLSNLQVANITGLGNIATVNLDGSSSNVLYGNGVWAAAGSSGDANYANYAGNVTIGNQPNITSLGTLTSLSVTGNVSANAYQLTTSPGTITVATGQMAWSASEQTMNLGMNNGVIQQVGLENYILVKASSAITNGQVVMFTGASGDNILAAPANAASAGFKSDYIIGIATQDIALNDTGYITVFGMVHGLNTLAYTVGDVLWYDPTSTTGGMTNTRPTDPQFQIQVAAVTKRAGGDGHIQVRVTPFTSLTNLTDAQITTPSAGQALVYNGSNVWINGNPQQANIANTANSVAVANVVGIGNIATINLTGSSSTVLYGNGVFAAISGGTPGGTNTQVQFNDGGSFGGDANLTFNKTTGNLTASNIRALNVLSVSSGGSINAPAGTISGGTVTASTSMTAPFFTSNVATGTAPFTVTSTTTVANLSVANSTYANTAGTATSATTAATVTTAAQPNITSVGASLTASTSVKTSNIVAYTGSITTIQLRYGAVDGAVGITTDLSVGVGGTGNISAAGNITGSVLISNVATGTAPFTVTSTTQVANLHAAVAGVAGTVTTAAQPNITSTGTLVSVNVTGTANIGNLALTKYNETVIAGGSTGAATITPDVATGTVFNYTLTGNITLNSLGNAVAGSGATLILTQDATGNRTLTSTMKFLGGSKTLSTAANAIDILSVFYDGTTYYASLGKGYA